MFTLYLGSVALLLLQWSSFLLDSYLLQLFVAAVTAGFLAWKIQTPRIILPAALIAAYSPGLFYFWDEWELLTKFSTGEIPKSHNEHILPFYLPLLKFLFEEAGTNYYFLWAILALVHAGSCLLVYQLLTKHFSKEVSLFGVVFFAVHAHHSESTSWFLLFGLALVKLFSILLMLRPRVSLAATLSFIAPLFSSVGLLLPLQFGVYLFFYQREKLVTHLTAAFTGTALSVLLLGGVSAGSGTALQFSLFDFSKYLLVATEIGSTLRGFGLIPTLGLNYQIVADHLGITEKSLFLVLVISGISLSGLLFALLDKRTFLFFKLSSLAWLGPIIFARLSLKARGALAARYQEPVVAPASFLFCEIFTKLPAYRRLIFFVLILPQLFMGLTFRFDERQEWNKFSDCPGNADVASIVPNGSKDYMINALKYLGWESPEC